VSSLEWQGVPNSERDSKRMRGAVEQGDEADEAFGGMVARMDMPPHARAGRDGRGHRFAAYPRCSADVAGVAAERRLTGGLCLADRRR
jgi:hypothetical protein